MRRYFANALTLLNLFCGSVAVVLIAKGAIFEASLFVFGGLLFDFFDGFAARGLNIQSDLGIQLDSLADMVTSGVVPGLLMFQLLLNATHSQKGVGEWHADAFFSGGVLLPFVGFFITLASAYRLAKFNIDSEQQTVFKGLPTPANTLLIFSLPLMLKFQDRALIRILITNKWFLVALTVLSCYLLNANIKLLALKFKNGRFAANRARYIFIMLSVILLCFLKFIAIPGIVVLYIVISVLDRRLSK